MEERGVQMRNYNRSTYIIAGVIIAIFLVAFLIIKNVIVPLLVHYDTSGTIKQAAEAKSEEDIKFFNMKFEEYEKEEQAGKEVVKLIKEVINLNKNEENISISYSSLTYDGEEELNMVINQISY